LSRTASAGHKAVTGTPARMHRATMLFCKSWRAIANSSLAVADADREYRVVDAVLLLLLLPEAAAFEGVLVLVFASAKTAATA
jgi:hypothetical protein